MASNSDSLTPLVLENISLPDFIQYILKIHAAPSTLIVCSTKEAFLQQLQTAVATKDDEDDNQPNFGKQHTWTTPTLRILASSRTVQVVFCSELPQLRVYLAALHRPPSQQEGAVVRPASRSTRLLAILNPIQLHRPTSAFSAQGLNRTFAGAVEAAYHTKSRLLLAECLEDTPSNDNEDIAMCAELGKNAETQHMSNPWDTEVSLLNVTTKSFGAGERGWVGRTVKVRTIAGRWCVFQDMSARSA